MKILYKYFLLFLLTVASTGMLRAQDCDLDCVAIDCGFLNSSFSASGGPVFCEGEVITFTNESEAGFDYFIIDWSDGTVDTVFNYNPITHVYAIPDSLLCDAALISFDVCWVGVAECPEGTSCQDGSLSFALEVRPLALFSVPDPLCEATEFSVTDFSCNAETWFWNFGDGMTSTEQNPNHEYDTPGSYTISLEVTNSCGTDVFTQTIEVLGYPEASFTSDFDDPLCAPEIATFVNTSNQWGATYWTISPNDTTLWCFTDTLMDILSDSISIEFKEPGSYEITLTQQNDCDTDAESITLDVLEAPFYTLVAPPTYCDEETITEDDLNFTFGGAVDEVCWEFVNGSIGTVCDESFSVTFNQSGEVILTLEGPCGTITESVPVTIAQTTPISFINQPVEVCQDSGLINLNNYVNPTGGEWSGPGVSGGNILDPSTLGGGTYDITYILSDNADCPNQDVMPVEILDSLTLDLGPDLIGCDSLVYQSSITTGGNITGYAWEFLFDDGTVQTSNLEDPGAVTFFEDGQVILTISGACRPVSDTLNIFIQANVSLQIDPVPQPICSESSVIDLEVNEPNGIWSGPGIIDADAGLFDPGAVTPDNIYTITYALTDGACDAEATIDLEVVQSAAVIFPDALFCTDGAADTLDVDTGDGVFQGPGIIDTLNGVFDPGAVPPGSANVITYSLVDNNGCEVEVTNTVQVDALPVQSFDDPISLCLADFTEVLPTQTNYSVDSTGGTTNWSGPGILDPLAGTFNPVSGGLGIGPTEVFIEYTYNECTIVDTLTIILTADDPLALSAPDTVVCIADGSLQLMTNLPGGNWTGPGVDSDGLVDLNVAGGGTWTYNYLYQPGSSCEQEAAIDIQIEAPGETVDAGPDASVCEGPSVFTLDPGTPAGLGTWSGTGIIDADAGTIDLTQLQVDSTYIYDYCFESTDLAGCSACDALSFIIHPRPVAAFTIDGSVCIDQTFCMVNNSTGAVNYEWDFGDGTTSTDEAPCHSYSAPGFFTITLIAFSDQACADTISQEVYVSSPPVAAFTLNGDEGCAPFTVDVTNNSFGDSISQVWYLAGDTLSDSEINGYVLDSVLTDSIFLITLEVRNLCDTIQLTDSILVRPYPIVDFGLEFDEGCSPLTVDFINTTLGNPDTCYWDMGNGFMYVDEGEIDPTIPPDQTYFTSDTASTTYFITLLAVNECGTDTLTKEITVDPPEVEAFIEQDTLAGCQPFEVMLESVSTPGATTTWEIIWQDGNYVQGSNEEDPAVTLDSVGGYTVILYAANNCDEHTDTAFIEVLPAPAVSFTTDVINCEGDTVNFVNTSINVAGSIWDFGDGDSSTQTSPDHVYPGPGDYIVSLTATSLVNDCPATYSETITIEEDPIADFSSSALSGCSPLTIQFTNESSGETSYEWNFGDNTSGSIAENPEHTFSNPGNYTVTLVVRDEFNCGSDTSVVNVFVNDHPEAAFSVPAQLYCAGYDTLCLENNTQGAIIYEWEVFGQLYSEQSPCILPMVPVENDTIWLYATNSDGCVDTTFQLITVEESPAAAAVADPETGCEDLFVSFTNNSTGGDQYAWDFDNGNTSGLFAPVQWFNSPGTYPVELIVGNSNGCPADTAIVEVVVNPKPLADFDFAKDLDCGVPVDVQFTNTSSDNLSNDWTFGDGGMSVETSPIYTYDLPGTYPVELIVMNTFGCRDTLVQDVQVSGQPVAAAEILPAEGCEDLAVQFVNTSETYTSLEWQIETIGTFTDQEVVEAVFTEPGRYSVELYVNYNNECRDSLVWIDTVRVYESPIAAFDYVADEQENILGDVRFENFSQLADAYEWDLGDGTYSDLFEPVHEYDTNRFILVTLTAFNYNGGVFTCVDSAQLEITPEWITEFFAPNAMTLDYGSAEVQEFRPVGIGIAEYAMNIYSPFGNLVWFSDALNGDEPAEAWDGNFQNEEVIPGAYTWHAVVRFVDGTVQTYTGTVTVLK